MSQLRVSIVIVGWDKSDCGGRMRVVVMLVVTIALAGCAAIPMNPVEFREAVRKEGRNIDKFEINRAYADVTRTFQKMTPGCLNLAASGEHRGTLGTLLVSPEKLELHFQKKFENQVGAVPKGGMYFLVADVFPVDAERTRMEIYYLDSVRFAALAINGWARGENVGCPDSSRLF